MASLLTLEQLKATRDTLLASYNTLAATPIEEYSLQDRQVTYQRKEELWSEVQRLNRLIALRDPKIRAGGYAFGNFVSQKEEKKTDLLTNGDFSKIDKTQDPDAPTNWTVTQGALDQDELASGKIKGDGGAVHIEQTFDNLYSGTYKITIQRGDINGGAIAVVLTNQVLWNTDTSATNRHDFGFQETEAEFTLNERGINSLKILTEHENRALQNISLEKA